MRKSSSNARRLFSLAVIAVASACSAKDKPRGELMIVVSADLSIPKDLNQVVVEVLTDDGNKQSFTYPILPEDLGKPMPGTLAIVPPNAGGQHLRVRLIAERDPGTGVSATPRVVREATLNVPTDRVAMLPMPLRWLCDGHTMPTPDGSYRSDCAEDETCVAGKCVSAVIDTAKLPDYDPRKVFGGGDEQGKGGQCLNVQACFAQSLTAMPDSACTLSVPNGARETELNVALLSASGDGECAAGATASCYVPLDHDPDEGWSIQSDRIALPQAVCTGLGTGKIQGIALTTQCATKDNSVPLCGPWTNVRSEVPVGGDGASGAAGAEGIGGAGGEAGVATAGAEAGGTAGMGGGTGEGGAQPAGGGKGGSGAPGGGTGGSAAQGGAQTTGGNAGGGGTSGNGGNAGSAGTGGGSRFTEFTIPTASSGPTGITVDVDGNLWFTEGSAPKIGRITRTGVITEFLTPRGNYPRGGITSAPDGNLWFTESDAIGRITTAGVITEFTAAAGSSIVSGPDGNLWFTDYTSYNIGRMTPTGTVTLFPLPTVEANMGGITVGSDGNLWFTEGNYSKVGRITTTGTITEFPVTGGQVGIASGGLPGGCPACDGNLWFTESLGNNIGRLTPSGTLTEFPLPTLSSQASAITRGPQDGNLWFVESSGNNLGSIHSDGTVTEYPLPTPSCQPKGIVHDGSNALWFTEYSANKIGSFSGVYAP